MAWKRPLTEVKPHSVLTGIRADVFSESAKCHMSAAKIYKLAISCFSCIDVLPPLDLLCHAAKPRFAGAGQNGYPPPPPQGLPPLHRSSPTASIWSSSASFTGSDWSSYVHQQQPPYWNAAQTALLHSAMAGAAHMQPGMQPGMQQGMWPSSHCHDGTFDNARCSM